MGEGLEPAVRGVLAGLEPRPESPRVLGEYRLVRKLGEGGMAQVFLARHQRTGERVALKVLHPHFALEPERVAQLRVEANSLSQVRHENVVRIFALREEPPFPYLVMEFLEGLPLRKLMGKPVEARLAIPVLVQVCRALEAAHRRGVLHRDLKPDNIFLVPRHQGPALVKVLDFGLATPLGAGHASPGDGAVGTACFMAPEQWQGRPLDARTDLYALGVCAFGLATGKPPFTQANEDDLRWAHCHWPAPDPRSLHPGVSEAWAAVILKALAKDPAARYQSAAELAQALEAVLGEEDGPAPRRRSVAARMPRVTQPFDPDDPEVNRELEGREASRVLGRYRGLSGSDAYAVLDVARGARLGELWRAGACRLSELSAVSQQRLAPEQRLEVERARARVVKALCQLGMPHRRIARDAASGNLAGVARCIAAMGRHATEELRAARPVSREAARLARHYRRLGDARSTRGDSVLALRAYERALLSDPLNPELHQRYWRLKREVLRWGLSEATPGSPA